MRGNRRLLRAFVGVAAVALVAVTWVQLRGEREYGLTTARAACVLREAGSTVVWRMAGRPATYEGQGRDGARLGIVFPRADSGLVAPRLVSPWITSTPTIDGGTLYAQGVAGDPLSAALVGLATASEAVRSPEDRERPTEGAPIPEDSPCLDGDGEALRLSSTPQVTTPTVPSALRLPPVHASGRVRWARAADGCCVVIAVPMRSAATSDSAGAGAVARRLLLGPSHGRLFRSVRRALVVPPPEWNTAGVLRNGLIRVLGGSEGELLVAVARSETRVNGSVSFDARQGWTAESTYEDPEAVAAPLGALLAR